MFANRVDSDPSSGLALFYPCNQCDAETWTTCSLRVLACCSGGVKNYIRNVFRNVFETCDFVNMEIENKSCYLV